MKPARGSWIIRPHRIAVLQLHFVQLFGPKMNRIEETVAVCAIDPTEFSNICKISAKKLYKVQLMYENTGFLVETAALCAIVVPVNLVLRRMISEQLQHEMISKQRHHGMITAHLHHPLYRVDTRGALTPGKR
jgi:hypothetical protein